MALTHNSERELHDRGAEEEKVRLQASPRAKYHHKRHIKWKLKYTSKQESVGAPAEPRTLPVSQFTPLDSG